MLIKFHSAIIPPLFPRFPFPSKKHQKNWGRNVKKEVRVKNRFFSKLSPPLIV